MPNNKRGLGRGFEALLPTQLEEEFDPTSQQDEQISQLRYLRPADILPNPDQPRRVFDALALEELTASIREHGIMQPVVVTPKGAKYELVAGERRWRAAQMAGQDKIPALVRTLTDQHKLELALIENLQRQDLNPIETATAYLKLHEQFNLTYEQIGKQVGGKAVSTIGNFIRLLALPKEAKVAVVEGIITEGHARQILAIKEPEIQLRLLKLIVNNGWSVRQTERYVIGYKEGKKDTVKAEAKVQTENPKTQALSQRLSANVSVKHMAKGGRLVIRFKDDNDLNRISDLLLQEG